MSEDASSGGFPESEGQGIRGHLRLVCGPDSRGLPSLREQSFRAPIHLSKPHLDAGTLVVNVVNPTAGLLQDDRIHQDVRVQPGASLLLTSPSASRAHRVRTGWAEVSQQFHVAAGAALEVLPETFSPQAGASYKQSTRAVVESGGTLLLFETLSPGRVASGESFEYTRLDWRTDVLLDQNHLLRERYCIRPASGEVQALRRTFPSAYYGSAVVVCPALCAQSACWNQVLALHSPESWLGVSPLSHPSAWTVKWVCNDAPLLRSLQHGVRTALYAAIGRTAPDLRRVSGR